MSKWIRKGDRVLVIAGNDKGKAGEVLSRTEERVIVQGVNIRKKHMKKTQEMQGGRIIEMEVAIHISNVAICNKDNQPLNLKVIVEKNGERSLMFRDGSKDVVYRSLKKPA
ncbi:MAG: rplX [Parachlamydiales bacterium]|nr:rplX [Parachlamydiales bacterium]